MKNLTQVVLLIFGLVILVGLGIFIMFTLKEWYVEKRKAEVVGQTVETVKEKAFKKMFSDKD